MTTLPRKLVIAAGLSAALTLWLAAMPGARAMTVADLQKQLDAGEKLTLIDLRSPNSFTAEHIPGAINIPAALCPKKNFPPLGKVVIYDAGLGRDATDEAAAALAKKSGITVEILEGGLAAWQSAHGLTTRMPGLYPESRNYISYADLKRAKPGETLLVDLRRPALPAAGSAPDQKPQPKTDLAAEFPGFAQAGAPFDPGHLAASDSGVPPLIVLIDDGDGTSEAAARVLKSHSMYRYVILAGGEIILARHGQAGLERVNGMYRPLNGNPLQMEPRSK